MSIPSQCGYAQILAFQCPTFQFHNYFRNITYVPSEFAIETTLLLTRYAYQQGMKLNYYPHDIVYL